MHTDENEQSKQSRVTGRGEKAWNQKIRYFASICWCLGDPKSRPFLPAGLKCRLKICERLACICELCACKQPLCPPVTRATKIEYDCGYRRKIWNPSATPTVHGQTDKKKTANRICILGAEIKGVSGLPSSELFPSPETPTLWIGQNDSIWDHCDSLSVILILIVL